MYFFLLVTVDRVRRIATTVQTSTPEEESSWESDNNLTLFSGATPQGWELSYH